MVEPIAASLADWLTLSKSGGLCWPASNGLQRQIDLQSLLAVVNDGSTN
jgi:hypothetical protein